MLETKIQDKTNHSLSRNLSQLLTLNQLSESDLARELQLPYMTIKRLTSGSTNDPRLSTLQLIADYFKITVDSLVNTPLPHATQPICAPYILPILTWEMLSETKDISTLDLSKWSDWQPVALHCVDTLSPQSFALKSKISMHSRYPQGTVLVIDSLTTPQDGDTVLIKMGNEGGISLRDLMIDPPHKFIKSIITDASPIQFSHNEHEIIGTVVLAIFHSKK